MNPKRPLSKTILAVFTGIICLGGVILFVADSHKPEYVVLSLLSGIGCFLFLRNPAQPPIQNSFSKEHQKREKAYQRFVQQEKAVNTCLMTHVNGLPIAESMICTVTSATDRFSFSSGAMNFKLEKSKITDISIMTEREIQEQYVSSAGGAIAGAYLFGTLGAVIGGRAKKKKLKDEVHNYLIITYQSPDVKYIGFEIGSAMKSAQKFVDDFKRTASGTTVEL